MNSKLTLMMVALALAAPALAHPGAHDEEEVTREKSIPEMAEEALMREITRAKLEASWRGATAGKPELRTVGSGRQWVVPFTKAAGKGKPGTIYLTMTEKGEFVKASGTRP